SATILLPAYGRQLAAFFVLLTKERAVTGLVGAVSLAVFASHVFSLTRQVLNRAFRVSEPPGLIRVVVFDLLWVLLVGVGVIVGTLATIVLVAGRRLAQSGLPLPPITGLRPGLAFLPGYPPATT